MARTALRTKLPILATVMAVVAAMAAPAGAQGPTGPPCAPRDEVVALLHQRFGEAVVGRGLSAGGSLVEVYASGGGTWTIVATRPAGVSCLIAAGDAWDGAVPPPSKTTAVAE